MTEEMLQAINDRIKELGIRPRDIAYKLDKDEDHLKRFLRGADGIRYGYLVQILDYLGMEIVIWQ